MAVSLALLIRCRLNSRCSWFDRAPYTDSRLRNSIASSTEDLIQSTTVSSLSIETVSTRISPVDSYTSMPSASIRFDVVMAVPGRNATASESTTESPGINRPAHCAGTKNDADETAAATTTTTPRSHHSRRRGL